MEPSANCQPHGLVLPIRGEGAAEKSYVRNVLANTAIDRIDCFPRGGALAAARCVCHVERETDAAEKAGGGPSSAFLLLGTAALLHTRRGTGQVAFATAAYPPAARGLVQGLWNEGNCRKTFGSLGSTLNSTLQRPHNMDHGYVVRECVLAVCSGHARRQTRASSDFVRSVRVIFGNSCVLWIRITPFLLELLIRGHLPPPSYRDHNNSKGLPTTQPTTL